MIVATRPLIDCCPVVPAAMEGRQIVQWDKDSCADAGFLKIDLLGLGMLSAVERCVEMIARTRGERIDLSRIPFDDARPSARSSAPRRPASSRSRAARRCSRCGARARENLDELTIQVAIIRPGPIQGGAINPYIERRQRLREDPAYELPCRTPRCGGAARDARHDHLPGPGARGRAGLRRLRARRGRRAAPRDEPQARARGLERHRRRFVEGARATSARTRRTAERVWEMVAGFAGFGFPKAHSAAFGLLAYQSTWLRVHYGPEFLCALLNEQPMGFYAPDSLVHEAEAPRHRGPGARRQRLREVASATRARGRRGQGRASRRGCRDLGPRLIVRLGSATSRRPRPWTSARWSPSASAAGPSRASGELAARVRRGARARSSSSRGRAPATASSATAAGGSRRARASALWQLGIAAPGRAAAGGTQLALPLELPAAPRLRPLSRWQGLLADYATTGVTIGDHVLAVAAPAVDRAHAEHQRPARAPAARVGGDRRRPGHRPPAAGDREGHDVPAVRG